MCDRRRSRWRLRRVAAGKRKVETQAERARRTSGARLLSVRTSRTRTAVLHHHHLVPGHPSLSRSSAAWQERLSWKKSRSKIAFCCFFCHFVILVSLTLTLSPNIAPTQAILQTLPWWTFLNHYVSPEEGGSSILWNTLAVSDIQ